MLVSLIRTSSGRIEWVLAKTVIASDTVLHTIHVIYPPWVSR